MNTSLLAPDAPGIHLTAHGLRITRQLDWNEWRELLSQARRIKKTYLSVLSDITDYGRRNFGDTPVNEALEQLEFEMSPATKTHVIALVFFDRDHPDKALCSSRYEPSPISAMRLGFIVTIATLMWWDDHDMHISIQSGEPLADVLKD